MTDSRTGQIIGPENRQYELIELIGQGGMGDVYLAEATWIKQKVAVKLMNDLMRQDDSEEGVFQKRFEREFKLCVNAENDHIVEIRDYGLTQEGYPFYVMEYLQGQSLAKLIRVQGRIALDKCLGIVIQICKGLEFLHDQIGAIHRDLKPDNIFIVSTSIGDLVKILDLGIAKKIHPNAGPETNLTQTGVSLWSPKFTSPEQINNVKSVVFSSDIYCVGLIFYEMLTGTNPFGLDIEASQINWISAHIQSQPKSLKTQPGCETIPDALDSILMKCLQKNPNDRFNSARELLQTLEQFQLSITPGSYPVAPEQTVQKQVEKQVEKPSAPEATLPLSSRITAPPQVQPLSTIFNKNKPIKNLQSKSGKIISLCFSPNSQILASLCADQATNNRFSIEAWDLNKETPVDQKIYDADLLCVGFTSQNQLLGVSTKDGKVVIFKVGTKEVYHHIDRPDKTIFASFDSHQNFLLISEKGEIYQWNPKNRDHNESYIFKTGNPQEKITCVATMPNGKSIFINTSNKQLYQMIWKNRILRSVENKSNGGWFTSLPTIANDQLIINAMTIHPDNQTLVMGNGSKRIKLWNFNQGQTLGNLSIRSPGTQALTVSADGKWLASGHPEGLISIWQLMA
jgi:serine/threonine protein kinase